MTKRWHALGWLVLTGAPASAVVACGDDAREASGSGSSAADAADTAETSEVADASAEDEGVSVRCQVHPCVTHVSGGPSFACALLDDRSVWCWGDDARGQLGRGDAGPPSSVPVRVPALYSVVDVSAGGSILGPNPTEGVCAVRASGQVRCWGDGSSGQLELGTVRDGRRVSVGPTTACAIRAGGEVVCYGPLTTKDFEDGGHAALAVATSLRAAFVLTGDRALWSWGASSVPPHVSPLGRIVSSPTAEPKAIAGLASVSAIAASAEHACAVAEGRVFCWGNNTYGQLGIGSRAASELPLEVLLPTEARARSLALSERTSCAVTFDGRAFCWGANSLGELGAGDDRPRFGPTPVRALGAAIVEMAAMDFATCALLETGSVVCWGYNGAGNLGIGAIDLELHLDPSVVRFEEEAPTRDQ